MKKILIFYNLVITGGLTLTSFTTSSTTQQALYSLAFLPLATYFLLKLLERSPIPSHNQTSTALTPSSFLAPRNKRRPSPSDQQAINPEVLSGRQVRDIDRRLFLKLIGSAGLTTFIFSLFTDRTHAAFFGSVPGPGTVAIKDSSGNQIDPAEKQPTDGYEITELNEDDATYNYYGFVHKTGAWYVARETKASGSYRYSAGASSFSTNWTGRAGLTYEYFDDTF